MNDYFVRNFDLESTPNTLKFYQKTEGDVSCVVWDASIVLAKYLEQKCLSDPGFLKNKTVIELGAGVGCVGITAACYGAEVVLTDLPETIPLLNKNIEANKENSIGSLRSSPLIWGKDLSIGPAPDIILMADCIYYEESVLPLIETLRQLATVNTIIFLSQELRESDKQKNCWKHFEEATRKFFELYLIPRSEQNPAFSCPEIVVYKLVLITT